MLAKILDGRAIANKIKLQVKEKIRSKNLTPGLAVILVGDNHASQIYIQQKQKACAEVGIISTLYHLSENTAQSALEKLIEKLNHDKAVQGILLQLPLPAHLKTDELLELIHPQKDVDGFHPYNLGRLVQRRPLLRPCTPYGVMLLLNHIQQPYKGKHAVIVGASNIVGRPLALELLIAGATVTICHRFTQDLAHYVKQADILVSAVGKPNLI